jgi:signal transduction histidine kinase/CheY-like chemotaxis protein
MMINAINRNIQVEKIREAEERTQVMLDAAPISIFLWDNDLQLADCNQEAVKMFSLADKQEFIGKWKMLSPEFQPDGRDSHEKGVALVQKALDEGYSRFEWMHQKLDGEQLPVEVTCIRVKYRNEFSVTEYIRDLREQRAMIAEMRKAEIAEESSKAKSDFLAKMSHEIRTPMNAILGIAEIQLQSETHQPITKEAFERIYDSGSLLLGIINDILDLSKIEAGKLVVNPAKYDIASLIHDTVQLVRMRYESKPIEFILNVNENLPLILIGDELRIKQVLNNILVNAFKYTDEGSVSMTIYAELAETEYDTKYNDVRTIVFAVNDTGQGMTAEQVSKLGTEYARFNMEANRRTEGTGLGMNITRSLIQMMNGSLSIESTPGMGSTFTVRLPQKYVGSSIIGNELANNLMKLNVNNSTKIRNMQMKREFMPYGRVLVVDDVETNLYVARGLMAPYGVSIDTAISGFEAVEKIRDGSSYDIIFMDHMMPKMDGIEAAKIIRSLEYKNPIVALTANALTGQDQMFLDNGFDDFISKPIDIRSLDAVLSKFIHDRYPLEVIEAARRDKDKLIESKKINKSVDPQLAEFFVRDAKKALAIMESIYANKCRRADDISLLIINVHAMKSALANIGEPDLSAEASKLEQAAREQNINLILSDIPSFFERLNAVIIKNEAKIVAQKETEESGDNVFLREKLLVIKAACESFDKKTAKNALSETRKKTWAQSVDGQLANLAEYLLHSEFDEAIKFIDDYVKQLQ